MATKLTPNEETEVVARAICAEQCAVYGEPPCYEHGWPNPDCDEPGCIALAIAAIAGLSALKEHGDENNV